MKLSEKVAYLKGLEEGLNLDSGKSESKLIKGILEAFDEIVNAIDQNAADLKEMTDRVDELDMDLGDLEDILCEGFGVEELTEDEFDELGADEDEAFEVYTTDEAPAEEAGKMYIPVMAKGFQHQFWQAVAKGSQDAADKYGVEIYFDGPASETEIAAQVNMIEQEMAKNPKALALAALDVAGAPAQARKLPHEGDSVLILGANGKSGVLCGWEAMKKVGPNGKVVGVVRNPKQVPDLMELGVYTDVIVADCTKPVEVMEAALAANNGNEYDLSICCVNIESCEMSAILPVRDDGKVYFFSMATSFTKAALGAEGIGKDVEMIVGNGYTKNHANITLDVLRESEKLRKLFDEKYV